MQNDTTENSPAYGTSALTAMLGGWELPDGWGIECPDYVPDCVVVSSPKGGYVTVDFHQRIFGLGHGKPRAFRNSMTFKGCNWRLRLMAAAAEYLIATMDA